MLCLVNHPIDILRMVFKTLPAVLTPPPSKIQYFQSSLNRNLRCVNCHVFTELLSRTFLASFFFFFLGVKSLPCFLSRFFLGVKNIPYFSAIFLDFLGSSALHGLFHGLFSSIWTQFGLFHPTGLGHGLFHSLYLEVKIPTLDSVIGLNQGL